jgi:hypothetical protein
LNGAARAARVGYVRSLPFARLTGAFVLLVAACGLDGNGLGPMDDGGAPDGSGDDAGAPPPDATSGDAVGAMDSTALGDSSEASDARDGSSNGDSSLGDASADTGSFDASDSGAPDANDAGGDAGRDTGTCGPAEICNNGVDDDCNGLTDCADPACAQWTCTGAPIPAGWSLVDFVEASRPACSEGYSGSVDVVGAPDAGAATCDCTCAVTSPGSCTSGTFSAEVGLAGGACGPPSFSNSGASGACGQGTPFTVMPGTKLQVTPAPYVAGACGADAGTVRPPVGANDGRVCGLSTATGAGCANGGACAPLGTASLCVMQAGAAACPSGFSSRFTVGSGIDDTRTCAGCSCTGTSGSCIDAKLTIYSDAKCGAGNVTDIPADGGCGAVGGPANVTYNAYTYSATLSGETCSATTATSTGGVQLTGVQTICCP